MSSSVRIVLFLILLTSSLLSRAQAQTTTILLFGDSIIAGYGLSEPDSLSVQLQRYLSDNKLSDNELSENKPTENKKNRQDMLDITVINAGVSGDTTSAGLSRLNWSLKRNSPDIVFLALGGNDVLRGLPPKNTRQNLDGMLEILQQNDINVILSKVQAPPNLGESYMQELHEAYETLAKKYNVPLYPFLLEDVFNKPDLMLRDGIHPSEAGILVITKALGDYLIEYMSEQVKEK